MISFLFFHIESRFSSLFQLYRRIDLKQNVRFEVSNTEFIMSYLIILGQDMIEHNTAGSGDVVRVAKAEDGNFNG